jgi:signal transduction histidine kinase
VATSSPGSARTGVLRAALGAAERGTSLIQDLLTFARRKPLHPRAVDVSAAVHDTEKILKQTINPDIRRLILAKPSLRPAWVDPNQLELAILNLALNARDAMPNGGSLQIACENRRVEAGNKSPDLTTGDYVVVTVTDTGAGMSDATLAHAFEPFFTTKEVGRGSGLGLSMVQGFAEQSGGAVQIVSALGEGTHVTLWLPCAEERSSEMVPLEPGGAVLSLARRGSSFAMMIATSGRLSRPSYAVMAVQCGKQTIPQSR